MKLLADENIPRSAVDLLRDRGHDVAWVKEVAPAATDEEVLELAATGGYLLISFDKDIGELIVRREMRQAAGMILFRAVMASPDATAAFIAGVIGSRDDWEGHLSVRRSGCDACSRYASLIGAGGFAEDLSAVPADVGQCGRAIAGLRRPERLTDEAVEDLLVARATSQFEFKPRTGSSERRRRSARQGQASREPRSPCRGRARHSRG